MSFRDVSHNPNLISGIHNYCDRWCEHCQFTARCAVYVVEEADPDNDPGTRDINNAAFWQKLSSIFQNTHQLIAEWAEENGVDLDDLTLSKSDELQEQQRSETQNHPLVKAAERYAFEVNEWFDRKFTQVGEEVTGYVDVILWYQFFIAVKLTRGLMSKIDEDDYVGPDDPRDSDGSAKAALSAIDRSIGAWKAMYELTPRESDSISAFLVELEQLRFGVESEFPDARDFIRPGFDEPTLDLVH